MTLTAIHPQARFGRLSLNGNRIAAFQEKVVDPNQWVNGGYFVLSPKIFELYRWRLDPVGAEPLADSGRRWRTDGVSAREFLAVHGHACRKAILLNDLWHRGDAPWKRWAPAMVGFGVAVSTGSSGRRSRPRPSSDGRSRHGVSCSRRII